MTELAAREEPTSAGSDTYLDGFGVNQDVNYFRLPCDAPKSGLPEFRSECYRLSRQPSTVTQIEGTF
jgi:hypothetical protein